ncbi:flagellar hook capping FlgD N-terminal domain-containing protein [uncultured Arcobacter sp.]|uniref:flagellar hook capping FlgD N-terminal domain-containing protein n=1 Tax=uncultured Arcobacter sp. TaxID=165434 RepID=UPI00262F52B6|nr:flagellar hook capping FlgD N-terminal domain-containing protein [uncultured Arcobacter sp.]
MAGVDGVSTSTKTTATGQQYTAGISNDGLTNEDFLKLMLEELKLQDPTKPMDSASMLDSQMQMSSIQTNLSTIEAMESLQNSFSQMALASATDVIGRIVEDGNMGQDGNPKSFQITSVESDEGKVIATGYQVIGYDSESGSLILAEDMSKIDYDNITKIY